MSTEIQNLGDFNAIRHNPDVSIGTTDISSKIEYVCVNTGNGYMYRNVSLAHVNIMFNCIDELISNVSDRIYLGKVKAVEFGIFKDDNGDTFYTIYNDGPGFPLKKIIRQETGTEYYGPEAAFTLRNSGSNFNKDKISSGKNGLGLKIALAFATRVELTTTTDGTTYSQTYTIDIGTGTSRATEPVIASADGAPEGTYIEFHPDMTYPPFSLMKKKDVDISALIRRRLIDLLIIDPDISVSLCIGDTTETFTGFDPIEKCIIPATQKYYPIESYVNDLCYVQYYIFISDGTTVSYVNGMHTPENGTHITKYHDAVVDQIIDYIKIEYEKAIAKNGYVIERKKIKELISLVSTLYYSRPIYNSQTKDQLRTPASELPPYVPLDALSLHEIVQSINVQGMFKRQKVKRENDVIRGMSKKKEVIEKHYPANMSKSSNPRERAPTVLIVVEGDSALGGVMSGLKVLPGADDYYGLYPLRGKIINFDKKSVEKIDKSQTIVELRYIVGLECDADGNGIDYSIPSNRERLNYGSIMILTDSDPDGIHIQGLVMNMFKERWPSLFRTGYIRTMRTPYCRKKKKVGKRYETVEEYFSIDEARRHILANTQKGVDFQFFKGLATHSEEEMQNVFMRIRDLTVGYKFEGSQDIIAFNNTFCKDVAPRKPWVMRLWEGKEVDLSVLNSKNIVTMTEFINIGMGSYARYQLGTKLPSAVDGFKVCQRKAIHVIQRKKVGEYLKINTLVGEIITHTNYHHGNTSMEDTIAKMARDFAGSNNLPCVVAESALGSREADRPGAARYTRISVPEYFHLIFRPEDRPILEYINDEGSDIEPKSFAPIIPMILINGSKGIAIGFSSNIPKFHPLDIIDLLASRLVGEKTNFMDLVPWFNKYGSNEKTVNEFPSYITEGSYVVTKQTQDGIPIEVVITELPATGDKWSKYDKYYKKSEYISCVNYAGNPKGMKKFVLTFTAKFYEDIRGRTDIHEILVQHLYLRVKRGMMNMTAFDGYGKFRHYLNPEMIFNDFYKYRYDMYQRRKAYCLAEMEKKLTLIQFKCEYIKAIIDGRIIIAKRKRDDLIAQIHRIIPGVEILLEGKPLGGKSYSVLTEMATHNIAEDEYAALEDEYNKVLTEYETYKNMTIEHIWLLELNELKREILPMYS